MDAQPFSGEQDSTARVPGLSSPAAARPLIARPSTSSRTWQLIEHRETICSAGLGARVNDKKL